MTMSAGSTMIAIAGLTWKRLLRGRSLWIAGLIALLPVAFGAVLRTQEARTDVTDDLLAFQLLVLSVLPPMFISSSIGEEIEDRTMTYLWSRPIPRWTVVIGKLLALAPIAMVLVVASWQLGCALGLESVPDPRSHVALAAGVVAVSAVATGVAVLVPRHGMALTIGYMLLDFWLGLIPASIQNLSICHAVIAISLPSPGGGGDGVGVAASGGVATSAAWMAVIAGIWLGVALWRIRRLEA